MLWAILFGGMFLLAIASIVFLIRSVKRFQWIARLSEKNKIAGWIVSILLVFLPLAFFWEVLGSMNAIIILLHLVIFLLLSNFILYVIQKRRKKTFQHYYAGGIAILITVLYLAVGWVQAFHVWQTEYTIHTDKKVGNFKVALFADSHVGTTFDGKGLKKHIAQIQKQNPDILVIAGDFVDEDTSKKDMIDACKALKNIHPTYGTYFVFGNHDKGKYSNGERGYTGDDLIAELEKNGVTVLQDENVLIDNRFYVIGRQDASEEMDFGGSRKSVQELTKDLDKSKFSIVLDYQPREYDKDAKAGVNLVLSGHTHGGQLIPLVQLNNLFHPAGDDRIYGMEQRKDTGYIVTSGISDWAIKFKTGCKSEYVLINVVGK